MLASRNSKSSYFRQGRELVILLLSVWNPAKRRVHPSSGQEERALPSLPPSLFRASWEEIIACPGRGPQLAHLKYVASHREYRLDVHLGNSPMPSLANGLPADYPARHLDIYCTKESLRQQKRDRGEDFFSFLSHAYCGM